MRTAIGQEGNPRLLLILLYNAFCFMSSNWKQNWGLYHPAAFPWADQNQLPRTATATPVPGGLVLCSSTQLFYPLQTAFRDLFFVVVVFPFLLDRNPPLIQAQDQGEPRSSLTRGHTQPGGPAYLLQLLGERPRPTPPILNGCCRGELGFRPLPAAHLGQPQEEAGPFSSRQTTCITHANALHNGGVPLGTSSLPP